MIVRKTLRRILSVCLCIATLGSVLAAVACEDATSDFEYKTDISSIKKILNTTDEKYLVLVNKDNPLDEDYAPESTAAVNTKYTNGGKEVELEENVKIAAEALIMEMIAEGFKNVYITSGYRSYTYQNWLFDYYCELEKERHPSWSDERISEYVLTYSAYPGTSEHQTGLCMDLMVIPGMTELVNFGDETDTDGDVGFAETEEFEWLSENAHKFGFILRYPEDKVDVTKYSYESWHYRFVGIAAATEIHERGITLEEYLKK